MTDLQAKLLLNMLKTIVEAATPIPDKESAFVPKWAIREASILVADTE